MLQSSRRGNYEAFGACCAWLEKHSWVLVARGSRTIVGPVSKNTVATAAAQTRFQVQL